MKKAKESYNMIAIDFYFEPFLINYMAKSEGVINTSKNWTKTSLLLTSQSFPRFKQSMMYDRSQWSRYDQK